METFLLYFDLRKFSVVEQTREPDEVLRILNLMHGLIEAPLGSLGAELYAVHTDTAIWLVSPRAADRIAEVLRTVKDEVDGLMAGLGLPSRLHVACVYGEVRRGTIALAARVHANVSGPAMDDLQFHIHMAERYGELNQEAVFSAEAWGRLPDQRGFRERSLDGHRFFVASR